MNNGGSVSQLFGSLLGRLTTRLVLLMQRSVISFTWTPHTRPAGEIPAVNMATTVSRKATLDS